MKKIIIFLSILLIPSVCFASQAVHVINSANTTNLAMDSDGRLITISNNAPSFDVNTLDVGKTEVALGATTATVRIYLSISPDSVGSFMWIGPTGVTRNTGFYIASGTILTLQISSPSGLYAISDNDSSKLCIMTEKK